MSYEIIFVCPVKPYVSKNNLKLAFKNLLLNYNLSQIDSSYSAKLITPAHWNFIKTVNSLKAFSRHFPDVYFQIDEYPEDYDHYPNLERTYIHDGKSESYPAQISINYSDFNLDDLKD